MPTLIGDEPQGLRSVSQSNLATPPADANRVLWFDASDSSTITQVATAVSQWNDKSAGANTATQASGPLKPVFTANAQNALSTLQFNGMAMGFGTAAIINRSLPFYLGIVFKPTAITGGNFILALNDDTASGNSPSISISSSTFLFNSPVGVWSPVSTTVSSIGTGSYHILELVYSGAGSNTAGNFTWYYNKTLQVTGTAGTTSAGTNNALGNNVSNSAANAMNGFIAEVIVSQSSTLQAQYEAYFVRHWGL